MNIPSSKQCVHLINEMKMLAHIVDHSIQVCRVALLLTEKLSLAGITLDYKLVRAASLLHDITKTRSFTTGENHASTGDQFLRDLGYPDVGRVVGQHVRLKHYSTSEEPGEEAIVNYADKRVLHDKIVSLEKRMEYIFERYGKNQENQLRIQTLWKKTKGLEKKIFSYLVISPEDLEKMLFNENEPEGLFLSRSNALYF